MRNHLCCSALILLAVFGCGGTAAVRCGGRCVCLQCPAGQEPSKPCEQLQNPAEDVQCQSCPSGSFSDALDAELCRPHTSCEMLGRKVAVSGTVSSDVVCSDCLPGFHPSAKGQISTQSSCIKDSRVRAVRTVDNGPATGAGGPSNSTVVRSAGEKTEYAVFALVPVFCIMGLMGILICNILKKKGYNCTAEKEGGDEEMATPQKEGNSCPYISDDLNEDTISVLVRLITEKKENAEALEELLLEYESKQMSKGSSIKLPMLSPLSTFRSLPRLCPHHSHLHTISGLSGLAPRHGYRCSRCAQKKWPPVLIPPLDSLKDPLKPPQRLLLPSFDTPTDQLKNPLLGGMCVDTHHMQTAVPKTVQDKVDKGAEKEKKEGELTVLSVGRFQVAHIPENKPATLETKTSYQEKRSSLFAGKHFSSSSSLSSAFRR